MVRRTATPPAVTERPADEQFYDASGGPVAAAVVEASADAAGVDPTTGPPLYESIDPTVLEAIVRPGVEASGSRPRVTFEFQGQEITVWQNGSIRVREAPSRP